MSDSALPRSVFTNALNHANIDVQHAAELLELVEKLKPSEQEQAWRQARRIGVLQLKSSEWARRWSESGPF